jgi:hypothetical protein
MSKFASHDPRMISVFEIVGAYFVDTVFNHVYSSAQANLVSGSSLTDEYCRRLQSYVIGVKNDEQCYGDIVQGVHKFFTGTTRYTALSFADFVDRIVGLCIPEDYFRQFTPQEKDEILSSILCDLVSNLAAFATKPDMLRRIIDGHGQTPDVTVRMLQDGAVHALIAKRGAIYNQFIKKIGQARDTVPMDLVDDMKKALRRLVKEKREIATRAEEAEAAAAGLKKKLQEARAREAKLMKLVELLKAGAAGGAAAAGTGLRIPRANTIGEMPPDTPARGSRVPRRERIAEHRDEEEESEGSYTDDSGEYTDEDEDEGDDEEEEEDERPSRGRKASHSWGGGAQRPNNQREGAIVGGRGGRAPPRGGRTPAKTAPSGAKPKGPAVGANFFKTAPLSTPSHPQPQQKPAHQQPQQPAGSVTAAQLRRLPAQTKPGSAAAPKPTPSRQQPAMLTSLLDNVVDVESDSTDLDSILYGKDKY